jgi:hypothetical protein
MLIVINKWHGFHPYIPVMIFSNLGVLAGWHSIEFFSFTMFQYIFMFVLNKELAPL